MAQAVARKDDRANIPAEKPKWSQDVQRDYHITEGKWRVLVNSTWPAARTKEAVLMALDYCRARNLDPFKRPVHIVPVYDKISRSMIETVWPGIAELRTTATRTGTYAGCDEIEFGDDITEPFPDGSSSSDDNRSGDPRDTGSAKPKFIDVTFPEWARLTVYRIVQGQRVKFVGPKVFWKEAYATKNNFTDAPNDMWRDRKSGQLEKCAEAAALRRAFPEELGGEYAAEEMWGRVIEHADPTPAIAPPRPQRADFQERQASAAEPQAKEISVEPESPTAKPEAKPAAAAKKAEATAAPAAVESGKTSEAATAAAGLRANAGNDDNAKWLADQYDGLDQCTDEDALDRLQAAVERELPGNGPVIEEWVRICNNKARDIIAARKAAVKR